MSKTGSCGKPVTEGVPDGVGREESVVVWLGDGVNVRVRFVDTLCVRDGVRDGDRDCVWDGVNVPVTLGDRDWLGVPVRVTFIVIVEDGVRDPDGVPVKVRDGVREPVAVPEREPVGVAAVDGVPLGVPDGVGPHPCLIARSFMAR